MSTAASRSSRSIRTGRSSRRTRSPCLRPGPRAAPRRSRPDWRSRPDGRRLFVCGNLSNRLLELDPATGAVERTFDVGVAPFDVVLAAGKAYVSNWGGRPPEARRSHGTRRPRHRGQGRPGPAHRGRGLGQRHRPLFGHGQGRSPGPAPRLRPGPLARRPLRRLRQRRFRQPQCHRHLDRHGRRDDLGQGHPGRPFRGLAQRPRLFPRRQDALCGQRHSERRRRDRIQAAEAEILPQGSHPRRLVPGRAGHQRPARHPLCRQHQGPSPQEGPLRADRGPWLQLLPISRLHLDLPRAAAEDPLGLDRVSSTPITAASGSPRPFSSRAPDSRPGPSPSGSASRASSSTSSTSSKKTGPTTRSWATSPRATATRPCASSARP